MDANELPLDLDNPPPSEPSSPCRPADLARSNTFGEMSPQATRQRDNISLQQEHNMQEEVASGKLELELSDGTIIAAAVSVAVLLVLTFIILGVNTCASLRRRASSSSSNSNNTTNNSGAGVAGNQGYVVEMQAHGDAPQQVREEDVDDDEDEEQQKSQHEEQEHRPLSEHNEEDCSEEEETAAGEEGDQAQGQSNQPAGPVETGTARVAHLVARGAVSMVDIRRRRKPRAALPSSQTVRDISSLPDLEWAQSLTTGGGRSAVVSGLTSAGSAGLPVQSCAAPTRGTKLGDGDDVVGGRKKEEETLSSSRASSSKSSKESKRKVLRKMVGRNRVKEWCERGMGMSNGGGFGPYAGMY